MILVIGGRSSDRTLLHHLIIVLSRSSHHSLRPRAARATARRTAGPRAAARAAPVDRANASSGQRLLRSAGPLDERGRGRVKCLVIEKTEKERAALTHAEPHRPGARPLAQQKILNGRVYGAKRNNPFANIRWASSSSLHARVLDGLTLGVYRNKEPAFVGDMAEWAA